MKIGLINLAPVLEVEKNQDSFSILASKYRWKHNFYSIMPAAYELLATSKLDKNSEGKYSPESYARSIIEDPMKVALARLFLYAKRGDLIDKQSAPELTQYAALTPLLLAAMKSVRKIQYSEWQTEGLDLIIPSNLLTAMTLGSELKDMFSKEELINYRERGRLRAGVPRALTACYSLYGLSGTELFSHFPALAATMLTQTWVAHPSVRSNMSILDPWDWDNMPEPLVTESIIPTTTSTQRYSI